MASYITLTDDNFKQEVLESEQPVLVDFWAVWCGPCRVLAPIIEQLAEEYKGRIKVAKMDVDFNANTPMQYGIRSIPTLLFFSDGAVRSQMIGAHSKKRLSDWMERLMGAAV